VSLREFQRALADMVGSPLLASAVRAGRAEVLESYDLTARERRRLDVVAAQQGMEVSCTLYRWNRLTPVLMLLPYTCFVLGDRMREIAGQFWDDSRTDLQFRDEIERFAAFLRELLDAGKLDDPLLREVLDFELAVAELRFLPRRKITRAAVPGEERLRLHPLVRLVHFRHDPEPLLARLAASERPPYEIAEGHFPLLLVAEGDELEVRLVDVELASLLETLGRRDVALSSEDAELLVREGLAVR
jgi:hypothetical protein